MSSENGRGRPPSVRALDDITLEPVSSVPPINYGNAVARYRVQEFLDSGQPAAAVRSDVNWRSVYDALKYTVSNWGSYIPVAVTYRRGIEGNRTVYLQRTDQP